MLIVAGLMISFTSIAQPQGPRGDFKPEDMAKRQTEMVKTATGINDATEKKVYDINLKYAKKMAEMREKGDRDSMRDAMMKQRTERDAEIKGLLTADQYKKYAAQQEEMRKNRQGGGGSR